VRYATADVQHHALRRTRSAKRSLHWHGRPYEGPLR
jgi:hypothetical protein